MRYTNPRLLYFTLLSMNVVTQLTQFVGHDVINKNTTDLLRADWLYAVQLGQLSSVKLS